MSKFQEYLNSRGKIEEKGKISDTGDVVDMPTPKAKEDPHKMKRSCCSCKGSCSCAKNNKQPQTHTPEPKLFVVEFVFHYSLRRLL